ncbi:hypothetical protein EJ07DRAFT_183105 [Lizonia empirigonia]|nr:hypothetical protein EJ07DRAFT_183105 [Lizonia empirigonia]
MATFTSVPPITLSKFRYYDPSSLKGTKSKVKTKVTESTLCRDHTEATYSLGLPHQDTEGDLHAISQQTLQFQAMTPGEETESVVCNPLGADHGKSTYDIASDDRHYLFGCELLDEGGVGYATRAATSDSATNWLLDGSSQDFHLIDTVEEEDSAAPVQLSNKASDHQENDYDLAASNTGDHVSQRNDSDAAVQQAFSGHVDAVQEGSPVEGGTLFGTIGLINRPFATLSATGVIGEPELKYAHPAKRHRLAERQAQSTMLEPGSTPKSTSILNLSDQASPSTASPRAAGRNYDGATDQVLPASDLRDEENGLDAHVQGTIDELLHLRRSISPLEEIEGEQDVFCDADRRKINQQNSVDKAGESFEDRLSQNKEGFSIRPSKPRQRVRRDWAPKRNRGLSKNAPRPLYYNTVSMRAQQESLNPVALGHKFFGKQGKIIRMTQLSPNSWVLLGYRCNNSAPGLYNRGSLNAEWMSSSHSDAAIYGTDHSEEDWDEDSKDGDQGTEVYSRRTHKHWLESDEELLLSLKDKQSMKWKEVCERFPGRSLGAVKLRYYMLHKRDR